MAGKDLSFEKRKALLVDKAPELLERLKLSSAFWALLVKNEVLQKHHADDIQVALTFYIILP